MTATILNVDDHADVRDTTSDFLRAAGYTAKAYLEAMRAADVHAVMVVPIVIANAVEGLLYVNSRRRRAFTDQEEILLRRLADHAGLAIRNAQLFVAGHDARADAHQEYRMQRKDGRWIWVHSRGELITEASGLV